MSKSSRDKAIVASGKEVGGKPTPEQAERAKARNAAIASKRVATPSHKDVESTQDEMSEREVAQPAKALRSRAPAKEGSNVRVNKSTQERVTPTRKKASWADKTPDSTPPHSGDEMVTSGDEQMPALTRQASEESESAKEESSDRDLFDVTGADEEEEKKESESQEEQNYWQEESGNQELDEYAHHSEHDHAHQHEHESREEPQRESRHGVHQKSTMAAVPEAPQQKKHSGGASAKTKESSEQPVYNEKMPSGSNPEQDFDEFVHRRIVYEQNQGNEAVSSRKRADSFEGKLQAAMLNSKNEAIDRKKNLQEENDAKLAKTMQDDFDAMFEKEVERRLAEERKEIEMKLKREIAERKRRLAKNKVIESEDEKVAAAEEEKQRSYCDKRKAREEAETAKYLQAQARHDRKEARTNNDVQSDDQETKWTVVQSKGRSRASSPTSPPETKKSEDSFESKVKSAIFNSYFAPLNDKQSYKINDYQPSRVERNNRERNSNVEVVSGSGSDGDYNRNMKERNSRAVTRKKFRQQKSNRVDSDSNNDSHSDSAEKDRDLAELMRECEDKDSENEKFSGKRRESNTTVAFRKQQESTPRASVREVSMDSQSAVSVSAAEYLQQQHARIDENINELVKTKGKDQIKTDGENQAKEIRNLKKDKIVQNSVSKEEMKKNPKESEIKFAKVLIKLLRNVFSTDKDLENIILTGYDIAQALEECNKEKQDIDDNLLELECQPAGESPKQEDFKTRFTIDVYERANAIVERIIKKNPTKFSSANKQKMIVIKQEEIAEEAGGNRNYFQDFRAAYYAYMGAAEKYAKYQQYKHDTKNRRELLEKLQAYYGSVNTNIQAIMGMLRHHILDVEARDAQVASNLITKLNKPFTKRETGQRFSRAYEEMNLSGVVNSLYSKFDEAKMDNITEKVHSLFGNGLIADDFDNISTAVFGRVLDQRAEHRKSGFMEIMTPDMWYLVIALMELRAANHPCIPDLEEEIDKEYERYKDLPEQDRDPNHMFDTLHDWILKKERHKGAEWKKKAPKPKQPNQTAHAASTSQPAAATAKNTSNQSKSSASDNKERKLYVNLKTGKKLPPMPNWEWPGNVSRDEATHMQFIVRGSGETPYVYTATNKPCGNGKGCSHDPPCNPAQCGRCSKYGHTHCQQKLNQSAKSANAKSQASADIDS